MENPFSVQTPECVSAENIVDLFVDVFSDFPKIKETGHTFINGPRGTGKSMMFRFLEPDCQTIVLRKPLKELPFIGILVPIKNNVLTIAESERLKDKNAQALISEHLLTTYVASLVFSNLQKALVDEGSENVAIVKEFIEKSFYGELQKSGQFDSINSLDSCKTVPELFAYLRDKIDELYHQGQNYLKKLAFSSEAMPYEGLLVNYLDFLLPLIQGLKKLPFMPDGPMYLMFDDADNLSAIQTNILNGWVYTRTSGYISLKISTQLNYKNYKTIEGHIIESPHDFSEINITNIYTNKRDKYSARVKEIIERRLKQSYGESVSAFDFFPPDIEQEEKIQIEGKKIVEQWEKGKKGKGARPHDDVTRYARINYMASLEGPSKNRSTYNYAGFEQNVHISSGIVRYFLDAAFRMYAEELSANNNSAIDCIPYKTQNMILRKISDEFLHNSFEKLLSEESSEQKSKLKKLENLVKALGGAFHQRLLDKTKTERKIFSFILSQSPDEELSEILSLGVRHGFFHKSYVGNKEGTGRSPLYILNRLLAPSFKLDPTGFAAYLSLTNEKLYRAIENPSYVAKNGFDRPQKEDNQADLFTGIASNA